MTLWVELLAVRNAEAALESPPAAARGWPRSARSVECRSLPWPFSAFASIASDCDGGTQSFEVVQAAFGYLREELALPVGDSYFPDFLCTGNIPYSPHTKPEDVPCALSDVGNEEFLARAGLYVRKAHQGWFDTVHGFLLAYTVKLPFVASEADPIRIDAAEPVPERGVRKLIVEVNNCAIKRRYRFFAPKQWQSGHPPRYLLLRYSAPIWRTTLNISLYVRDKLVQKFNGRTAAKSTPLSAPNWYVVDLWCAVGMFLADLQNVEVEIEVGGPAGAYVELHDLIQTSHIAADVERFSRVLKRYNMTASAFTSHGGGLVFAPCLVNDDTMADQRRLADVPANPVYRPRQLAGFGIRFMTTYSNTSTTRTVSIQELAFLNSLNDGMPVYDYHRYFYQPKSLDGATLAQFWNKSGRRLTPSLVDALGIHIEGFLEEVAGKSDFGGVIYTHLYAANKPVAGEDESWFERPFNARSRAALRRLSENYLNPAGAIAPSQRIMVAPLPTLLNLSIMLQQIEGHAYYDNANNAVHVEPWYDPVIEATMPSAASGFRELRALTFYVEDSHGARLFVADSPIDDLIRNPPDETGRPSITVADASAPFVLLGRVPLGLTRANVTIAGANLKEPSLPAGKPPAGTHQITLASTRASLEVAPALATAANYQALRLEFAKSNPAMRLGVRLRFRSGLELVLAENGLGIEERHFALDPWSSTEPRVIVVPFYLMVETAARKPTTGGLGLGEISSWEVIVSGKASQYLTLDSFRLLRDCDRPEDGGGVIVGGQCDPILGIMTARMTHGGREYESKVAPNGIFIFSRKVERGSIVEILGLDKEEREIEPANGRFVEILTDKTDIDFIQPSGSGPSESDT